MLHARQVHIHESPYVSRRVVVLEIQDAEKFLSGLNRIDCAASSQNIFWPDTVIVANAAE